MPAVPPKEVARPAVPVQANQPRQAARTRAVTSGALRQIQARALYDFEAQESGDLSFRAGEIIEITRQDGNWWNGNIEARRGVFPSK